MEILNLNDSMKKMALVFGFVILTLFGLSLADSNKASANVVTSVDTDYDYEYSIGTRATSETFYYVPNKLSVTVYQDAYDVNVMIKNRYGSPIGVGYKISLERYTDGKWVNVLSQGSTQGSYVGSGKISVFNYMNIAAKDAEMRVMFSVPNQGTGFLYFTR